MGSLLGFSSKTRAPDAQTLINAQREANIEGQRRNALAGGRTGPFGSVQATFNDQGEVTGQTRALNQPLQTAADLATESAASATGFLPQDRFRLGDVPQGIDLASNFFNQQAALLQRPFADQRQDLDVSLTNRGLPIGSEARTRGTRDLLDAQNLALQNAAFQAVQLTPQEEQRQIANVLLERSRPSVEAGQALTLAGAVGNLAPQFAAQPTFNPVDAAGLTQQAFQNQRAIEEAERAQFASLLGAAGQTAGTIFGGPIGGRLAGRLFGGSSPSRPSTSQIPGVTPLSFSPGAARSVFG